MIELLDNAFHLKNQNKDNVFLFQGDPGEPGPRGFIGEKVGGKLDLHFLYISFFINLKEVFITLFFIPILKIIPKK